MKQKWRRWAVCAAIAVACAIGTRLLSNIPFFQILNLKSLDAQFVVRGTMPTSKIILLVADKKAFDTFAEPQIFWHPHYARAIEAASEAGAKVIGLDLAFGIPVEKWEPDFDRQLAGAFSTAVMAAGTPVVCGYVSVMNTSPASIMRIPINMAASAMGLSAFVNMTIDPDDFVRTQELLSSDVPPNGALALRVAEKFLGQDAVLQNGRLRLAGHDIPISSDRSIFINYAGPAGTFPHVSLADFLDAAGRGEKDRLRDWVKGKIVLIGTDSISDRFDTPFFTHFIGSQWNTAGVEVHANTIETILDHRFLVYAPEWGRMLGLLLVAAITAAIVMILKASRAVVVILIEVASIFFATQILFRAGLVVSSAELLITVVLCAIGTVIYRFATAERRGNLFSEAISLFVGKQVASTLDRTQKIHLSGKRLTVTIMFTDIRGFTAFTEKASEEDGPEVVVELLNQYMTTMVAIIVKFGGQVNKFIGDGILAVFSDEDEGAKPGDHALRAVQCAGRLVMAPSQFETGAGIHTGLVVIGNVGSAEKMEYTVLGDTVNLASRLESLNKENKTRVLMSEATQSLLQNEIETAAIGTVPVRGKTVPITLYTLPHTRVSKEAVSHVTQHV
ncbi:MAG: adenylate/guanylate cyclase domain-containing protein [Bryobacteraceae bacterium]